LKATARYALRMTCRLAFAETARYRHFAGTAFTLARPRATGRP